MKKLLTAVLVFLLSQAAAMAVPAYPGKRVMKMADGTQVTVTLKGDEFMHYFLTEDGRPMRLVDDFLQEIPAPEFLQMKSRAGECAEESTVRRAARVKHRAEYKGNKKGLVILVNFSDNEFSVPDPQKTFNDFFNKKGYTDYGMKGSVSDYFSAQSYGQFELDFDVVGPYKLPSSMKYYGGSLGEAHDRNAQDMIVEAVKAANQDVNYWDYDWDKDGYVDQVFVIYAGYGENYGASSDCVWPHESSIANKDILLDGVRLGTYACSCELKGVSGKEIDGIGAACHEFSHCLGIMDHYDTDGSNFGMGPWDLMCSGSYNNASCCPAAYTAYERWVSGWLEPVEVSEFTEVKDMKPLVEVPEAYVLHNEGNRNEYYLLENRQQLGFDGALPGHGLLVVHVDYNEASWKSNSINVGDRQRMTIIAADDVYSSYNLEGDPFPGIWNVVALTDITTPAAVTYNRNKDKSNLMHRPIECITEDAKGHISMMLCAKPLDTPVLSAPMDVMPTSFRVSWDAVEGADRYEVVLNGNAKRASIEESIILDEDFSGCYSKSAGFSDISGNLSNYGLPKFTGSKLFTTPDNLRIGTSTASGYLHSPVFSKDAIKTGDLTIVMKVKPYKQGTEVKGTLTIVTNTDETTQTFDYKFSNETTLVFHSNVKVLEIFRIDINPTSAMYIKGLTIYDGNFSDEEIGVTGGLAKAPFRKPLQELTVTDNTYVFTDLDPNYEYNVKVRAWQGTRCSQWSEELSIDGTVGIVLPSAEGLSSGKDSYYDLLGRPVSAPVRGLYIHNGRKVMR